MGMCASITSRGRTFDYNYSDKNTEQQFIHKLRLLQQEVTAILNKRAEESEAYEQEMLLMALKESEWKRERKNLKKEVKRLKKKLQMVRSMEEETAMRTEKSLGRLLMVDQQQLREERARRDEAVQKWKILYFAVKNELDHLIYTTQQGTLYWRAEEEELMEELQNELKAKDETIQVLKAKIASMEDEEYKKQRELDILKQSLRIMSSSNKESTSPTSVIKSRSVHLTNSIIRLEFV